MVLMQQAKTGLPKGLQDSLENRMNRGDIFSKTGANKLDIAIHYLYRACVTKDPQLMKTAVSQAFQPIEFTSEEGLQYDYSYLQHGPQLQIASYGTVFLSGEYKVASWVLGSIYSLSDEKAKMLDHYLSKTFLSSVRGRYSDFNIQGRGISRPNILDEKSIAGRKGKNSLLDLAKMISTENKGLIDSAIQRINETKPASYGVSPVHNQYWIGDYTQHQRPAYSFNVRTVSDRTKRTETGNQENLLGTFLPDGSTNIQRSGKEYFNIMPVWEWDKIPGITSRDFETDQRMTVQWGETGSTQFVGGVSDSLYGALAYDMDYNDVKAKKATFFFDKEVVSLGAGIKSNASENMVTTINQSWSNGKVITAESGQTSTVKNEKNSPDVNWVWHDSIGYFFPAKGKLSISNKIQKGSWKKINAAYSNEEISGTVFKMWFNHGAHQSAASYSYITVPGISSEEMKSYNIKDVAILSNTDSIQAVEHFGLKMIQVVFYKAGQVFGKDISISANKPCVVLLKKVGESISISIADPTHKLSEVVLVINSKITDSEKELICTLPQGHFAGSSANFNLKL
jgi:chondroitin AC lyase